MPAQSSLPGFDAAPKATDRLFFAIFPDADSAERIAGLAQQLRGEHDLKGRPLALDRFHVTLHHLGDYVGVRPDIVAMAGAAAAAVAMPPFEVVFDCAASFSSTPRNRPFVLRGGDGLAALMAFQQALGMAMKGAGLGSQVTSGYTPHVTLLYDDRCVAGQAVETIRWTVREFVLVHSQLGQSRHVPLSRWTLRG
ncbi:MAG: 2'-5' RNA ligase family protein [Polaromonas sp.]